MASRNRSIILFAGIAILLSAKTGLTLWQHTSPADQPAPLATVESTLTAALESPASQPEATAKPVDSWATLEAYLIPTAQAESAPEQSGPMIEDKTLASLRQYKETLEQRNQQLDKREQSLQQAEAQLKQRITELEQLEASIQQRLLDESKVKNKKIKRLTAVYEGMKADRAAPVIAKMELATVVKIFLLMDEKKVGKILSFLPPDKAVAISQALTRQISTVK